MGFKLPFGASERAVSDDNISSDSPVDAEDALRKFKKEHKWDPFLDSEKLDTIDAAVDGHDVEKEAQLDKALIEENSPYAEVRVSVPNIDDDELPVDTIRAWVIGAVLCTVVAACNVLLSLRDTPIAISSTVVQLISYPMGKAWAKFMPDLRWTILGREVILNPGPFNTKEHTIITFMTAAGSVVSYAIDILLAQEIFYGQKFNWGFQILLMISTQAMGFGLAGVCRRFLVWPAAMVWPATLVTATVMHSLHNHAPADPSKTNGWRIGRYKFFLIVAGATFVWEWIPQTMATFLQYFAWPTFIAPNNVIVNQLFGWNSGLGLIPMSLDWSVPTGYLASPLQVPGFALGNVGAGIILVIVGTVGLAFAGPDYNKYLPLEASGNYDRFAKRYNTSRILTPDLTFNQTAYEEYSPILLPSAFSLSYGMGFAGLMATVTHIAIFYGPEIWGRAKNSRHDVPDVHMKMMRKYKEAPEWWFMSIFAVSFAFGMIACQVWSTHMPWWTYILCILIGVFFVVPVGVVQAVTNQQPGLNIITEMIFGYMKPGRPIAMMLFKSWGYMTCANALTYISDMKVGHYMKVPPRSTFYAQAFAVFWLSIVQVATYNFLRGNIDGICTEDQAQGLTCPMASVFYSASVIWGVIGPAKVFGAGQMYSWTNYFWLIGFACPVIQYFVARRYPRSWVRYIFFPALFGAAGMVPPATTWSLAQWVIIGLLFNVLIRRRFEGWWSQYTYVLSGALDIGTALCVVLQGLGLGLGQATFPAWWGTTIHQSTLDASYQAVTKHLAKGDTLGPSTWS